MAARQKWIGSHAFLLTALTAFAASTPVFAADPQPLPRQQLLEEIVVTAHRSGAPQETTSREESELVLEVLRGSRDRQQAQARSEQSGRSQVTLGYEPGEDSGPLIESKKQQVALSLVRPANVIRIGF